MESLDKKELINLIQYSFPPLETDRIITLLIDLPNTSYEDTTEWYERRALATNWYTIIKDNLQNLNLETVQFVGYQHVSENNADLPKAAYIIGEKACNTFGDCRNVGEKIFFSDLLERSDIIIALTQYSATAPLKITATEYAFRAASMPGFCSAMLPALRIDLRSILKFCQILQKKLDSANAAKVRFLVEQKMRYEMFFDLRYRSSHVSAGYFPEIGMAGNLPSGETFIVPYEGEKEGESQTHGILPIQYNDTVVYYHINRNRARHVEGNSNIAFQEKAKLLNEPAYGNISELGFGVLSNFGIEPVGKILLDEKLGFHVAFGRSEHFGGFVGMQQFSSPKSAAHIDHIYIPQTQPKVEIEFVELFYGQNRSEKIFKKNRYTIFE